MKNRKGIILAGGSGTRLYPITIAVCKQLLPIYNKPMIYYPLTVLMLSGIRHIVIITTPDDQKLFQKLLGNGSQWGINLEYIIQPKPEGLAQAYILTESFLDNAPSAMVLGDNIFIGQDFSKLLSSVSNNNKESTIFSYEVENPSRYGVIKFSNAGKVIGIVEKPELPPSNHAVTGLYFLDNTASKRAKELKPSSRGELEITSLLETYINDSNLYVEKLSKHFNWFDSGTHESLLEVSNFVSNFSKENKVDIGSPDETARSMEWIKNSTTSEI